MPEKKPYDLAVLLASLKEDGLMLAEHEAKSVIHKTIAWLSESASISPMPYDDLLKIVYPKIEEAAIGIADKIDGTVGN
jgi:hypothetical protein